MSWHTFTALSNAVQQLRESVRLASIEASTALDDLCVANEKLTALEKRMLKAEKKLCDQWEENCALRQELKITKQEKKVLVKEIKVSRNNSSHAMMQGRQVYMDDDLGGMVFNIGREGERLIEELEEHVIASIELNKKLLANKDMEDASRTFSKHPELNLSETADSGLTLRVENTNSQTGSSDKTSPLRPKVLSLLDNDSDDENSSINGEEDSSINGEDKSNGPSCISSVGADLGQDEFGSGNGRLQRRKLTNREKTSPPQVGRGRSN